MLKLLIILLALNCTCCIGLAQIQETDNINFLATTIRNAYAGYPDKVKGKEFDEIVHRVKQSRSKDTFALLSQMTVFFKDHHLVLFDFEIAQQAVDSLQCKKTYEAVQRYFANGRPKDKYEGYWLSEFNNCVIAIKKVSVKPVTYCGYVVESNAKLIPGYCMLKMIQQKDGRYLTDYIDVDLYFRVFLSAKFKNTNTLWANSFDKFRRLPIYAPGVLANKKSISYKPKFTNIDENTVMLKMPSFRSQYIKVIDSLIRTNKAAIDSSRTLILDIRNNGGGFIDNYLPLLPYAYTGAIVHGGGYTLYSDAYIQNYEARITRYIERGDTIKAKSHAKYLDTIKAKKGQFEYSEPDTLAQGLPILEKPKNIAILINNNCLSSAELMVLNFRQSSKVTLFGEPTGGGVDYLNVMSLTLPRHQYSLSVPYTKRAFTSKEPRYDATGIKPDVEISDDITDWVGFVKKYYNEHQ